MSTRNTVDGYIDKKVYYEIDTNKLVIPIQFINDDMFNEMSDDLKIKYEAYRPTRYVKTREGEVFPIITDDDNNITNLTKNPPAEGGRRRKSRRRKSHRGRRH
jgi:hypothetical protein